MNDGDVNDDDGDDAVVILRLIQTVFVSECKRVSRQFP